MRRTLAVALSAIALVLAMMSTPAQAETNAWQRSVFNRINYVRSGPLLPGDACLDRYAENWAAVQASRLNRGRGYSHSSMIRLNRTCNGVWAGEIIGWGRWTTKSLVRAWLNSPPHRNILLTPRFRRMAVGSAPYKNGTVTVVNFIDRS